MSTVVMTPHSAPTTAVKRDAAQPRTYFDNQKPPSSSSALTSPSAGIETPPPPYQPANHAAISSRPPSYPPSPAAVPEEKALPAIDTSFALLSSADEATCVQPRTVASGKLCLVFATLDTVYTAMLNVLGVLYTLAQIMPAMLLNSQTLPAVVQDSRLLTHYTQLSWDVHDWLEEAELHPPSCWHVSYERRTDFG